MKSLTLCLAAACCFILAGCELRVNPINRPCRPCVAKTCECCGEGCCCKSCDTCPKGCCGSCKCQKGEVRSCGEKDCTCGTCNHEVCPESCQRDCPCRPK